MQSKYCTFWYTFKTPVSGSRFNNLAPATIKWMYKNNTAFPIINNTAIILRYFPSFPPFCNGLLPEGRFPFYSGNYKIYQHRTFNEDHNVRLIGRRQLVLLVNWIFFGLFTSQLLSLSTSHWMVIIGWRLITRQWDGYLSLWNNELTFRVLMSAFTKKN